MQLAPHPKKSFTGIAVVALLHLALLVLFLNGSRISVFKTPASLIELTPVSEAPPPPRVEPEQIPLPAPALPQILVPKLETPVVVSTPSPLSSQPVPDYIGQPSTSGRVPAATSAPVAAANAAPVLVPAIVDSRACTRPDYPKNALRNGDTGVVTLALLIGTDGRVADSRVEKSSGFRELDRAAQVGLGLCRFTPGTRDGVPQQSWTKMQYVWNLD